MESNIQIKEAVELIADGHAANGFNVLYNVCCDNAVRHILSKTRITDKGDAVCVFDDAILKINEDIKNGSFKYINDKAFYEYLNLTCFNLANNGLLKLKVLIRKQSRGKVIQFIKRFTSFEALKDKESVFIDRLNELRDEEYENVRINFGINLKEVKGAGIREMEYLAAFRKLKSECKILIVCRYCLGMMHEEIQHLLKDDYRIGSADTGKTKLHRCIKYWRKLMDKTK